MKKIFIVEGRTGEYSDSRDWPVKAFASEAAANELVDKLVAWLREHKVWMQSRKIEGNRWKLAACPLDPNFSCDYTGTDYFVLPVDFEE